MSLNQAETVVLKDALGLLQDGLMAIQPIEKASPILQAILTFVGFAIQYGESLIPPASPAAAA